MTSGDGKSTAATHAAWSLPGEEGEELRAEIRAARLGQGQPLPEGVIEVAPGVWGLSPGEARRRDMEAIQKAGEQKREGLRRLAEVKRLLRRRAERE